MEYIAGPNVGNDTSTPDKFAFVAEIIGHIYGKVSNGHCARRRVSEANRPQVRLFRPEIDRSQNIL